MKLRIRPLESRETLKVEIPSSCSLQDLKQAIAEKISISSETLHLSLNRKNEIIASPIDSLTSLGIASGDLIYYTQDPNVFLSETPIQIPVPQLENQQIEVSNSDMIDTSDGKIESLDASIVPQVSKNLETMDTSGSGENIETLDDTIVPQVPKTLEIQDSTSVDTCENMDTEAENLGDDISCAPGFLQKVYKAEVRNSNNNEQKLLITAVHAVLLEFGFVCVDSVNQEKIDGYQPYHLPKGWNMKISNLSLKYTLPALVRDVKEVVEMVILKFNTIGKFVCVYGCSSMKELIKLRLDASRFVPSINFLCASNCDATGRKSVVAGAKSFHEREVFELWKTVKDRLAIPLSIDLCIKTGLELPPCFMCLPTEVKMKILELLPGIDIAKVGCLSSELRYLCSNEDLWKQKCVEEFSVSKSSEGAQGDWKRKYCMFKRISTNSRRCSSRPTRTNFRPYPPLLPNRRWPRPGAYFPAIWGGESDIYPSGSQWNFRTHCDLGGFDA
ncbi:F-box protein skip22 [Thalictrum thalictroides]|uniref:F-box protein skip22 n=1 Tax=Thalictrum thalictroides TaxID=46969 RepID=A0A7J6W729_THATH|nr:F-box protein skip22 [Thalictrum thalictroides]